MSLKGQIDAYEIVQISNARMGTFYESTVELILKSSLIYKDRQLLQIQA